MKRISPDTDRGNRLPLALNACPRNSATNCKNALYRIFTISGERGPVLSGTIAAQAVRIGRRTARRAVPKTDRIQTGGTAGPPSRTSVEHRIGFGIFRLEKD